MNKFSFFAVHMYIREIKINITYVVMLQYIFPVYLIVDYLAHYEFLEDLSIKNIICLLYSGERNFVDVMRFSPYI